MAGKALILGGTGQIGQAVARNLLAAGWRVVAAQRDPSALPADIRAAGAKAIGLDRSAPGALAGAVAVAGGFDAVIDTIAYDDTDARQLLDIESDVGALLVISSGSVYRDDAGRTLDEARETGFPDLPVPIGEDQPTVAAGPATYSTRKVLLEQTLLDGARRPVTILRAGAIHGPGSRHPREWWFVKRILDGRRRIPLAWNGGSRFHTAATANLAELARVALANPGTRILNGGDPEALSVRGLGEAIAHVYGVDLDLVPIPGPPKGGVGATPWSVAGPIVFDMARAEALGYRAPFTYQAAAADTCRSAEAAAKAGVKFPDYINALFDYAAEDAFFADAGPRAFP